jgi:diguanylate cyclase (GGDEF)-like protein
MPLKNENFQTADDIKKGLNPGRLTAYYTVALLIIGSLSIFSHLLLGKMLDSNDGYASLINISGRQRMLSQRISSTAQRFVQGDSHLWEQLDLGINLFESSHQHLKKFVNSNQSDSENSKALQSLFNEGNPSLDEKVTSFVNNAKKILSEDISSSHRKQAAAALLIESDIDLLYQLDRAVGLLEAESDRKLAQIDRLHQLILMVVLVTLLCEAVFLFRPMIHKISTISAILLRLANYDPLTRLHNRRSFMQRCEEELSRVSRSRRNVMVLMIDLDDFKQINDTYGHQYGDRALETLGEMLLKQLRTHDIPGRLGGEEFAILLPETDLDEALLIANRLLSKVRALRITTDKEITFGFTMSIGVVSIADEGLKQGFAHADEALYQAKHSGKNQVMYYNDGRIQRA